MDYITNREIPTAVAYRREFKANSAKAVTSYQGYGRLNITPGELATLQESNYIVYSYATPIAWSVDGSMYMPEQKYSSTTSRHQSLVRQGMSPAEFEAHKAQSPEAWA